MKNGLMMVTKIFVLYVAHVASNLIGQQWEYYLTLTELVNEGQYCHLNMHGVGLVGFCWSNVEDV